MSNTSNIVKQRYNAKSYKQVKVSLKKELVSEWEEKLKSDGIGKAEFVRDAITKYLNK